MGIKSREDLAEPFGPKKFRRTLGFSYAPEIEIQNMSEILKILDS